MTKFKLSTILIAEGVETPASHVSRYGKQTPVESKESNKMNENTCYLMFSFTREGQVAVKSGRAIVPV